MIVNRGLHGFWKQGGNQKKEIIRFAFFFLKPHNSYFFSSSHAFVNPDFPSDMLKSRPQSGCPRQRAGTPLSLGSLWESAGPRLRQQPEPRLPWSFVFAEGAGDQLVRGHVLPVPRAPHPRPLRSLLGLPVASPREAPVLWPPDVKN